MNLTKENLKTYGPAIAECESVEMALQLSQFAFDHFADGIFWVTPNGRCIYVNDAACNFLGYPRAELVTLNFSNLISEMNHEAWSKLRKRLKLIGSTVRPIDFQTKGGSLFRAEAWINRLRFGEKEYYFIFVREGAACSSSRNQSADLEDQLEKKVTERTTALEDELAGREKIEMSMLNETEKIQTILDNAGQGFLTFGANLMVDIEYSEECRKLFGGEIWDREFPELLYPEDSEQQEFLRSIFHDCFFEKDPNLLTVFYSLLPSEMAIGDVRVKANYKKIQTIGMDEGARMLVVLTDITETRKLQNQIEEDRNLLKMVVKAVANFTDLMDAINDYRAFCSQGLRNSLDSNVPLTDVIDDIQRSIHTFKGTFGQLGFVYAVNRFHDLESDLLLKRAQSEAYSLDELRNLMESNGFENWLNDDLDALKGILGKGFFEQGDRIKISSSEVMELEHRVATLLKPSESDFILPKIRHLRYRPFKGLLRGYPEYLSGLSKRLQKPIHPLLIEGGDIMVDPDRYRGFARSLGHIFRNAIDHGLEQEEDRIKQGKEEIGRITCQIKSSVSDLMVSIGDDGGGVDVNKVRAIAAKRTGSSSETMESLSDDEAVHQILKSGISTKAGVTELSGRGIGLTAVISEVEKLGGTFQVNTEKGKGTQFCFNLPITESSDRNGLKLDLLMPSMLKNARSFMAGEMKLQLKDQQANTKPDNSKMTLEDITALIGLRGSMIGTCFLSLERKLAKYLVKQFAEEDLSPEEETDLLEDTMAEIANTILGNSLSAFPDLGNLVAIGSPFTIQTHSGTPVGFSGTSASGGQFETDHGRFSIGLLISNTLQ